MKIRIFYDNIDFRIRSWRKIKKLVEKVISEEDKISGDLNFIITNDTILKEINVKFLSHDYFTDVISFNYDYQNNLAGEIYISIDMVKRNAKNYKVSYNDELLRVIIHGVLHICDYDDKKDEERKKMRRLENLWMKVFKKM